MKKPRGKQKKRGFLKTSFGFLIVLCLALCGVWYGLKLYFTEINPIGPRVRSIVVARVAKHQSQFIPYNKIPLFYREAVIATEDQSFNSNIGIDFRGITRAIYVDLTQGQWEQGGSTITQQLVHDTLLSTKSKSLTWKIRETLYAIGLYDGMTKEDTFTLYVNDIYYGHGAYGLYSAAKIYFHRPAQALNEGELAMLAGLPNAPSDYDPYKNMKLARERQGLVIQRMEDTGVISRAQGQRILQEPIRLG